METKQVESYIGRVELMVMNSETKSEGVCALLIDPDGRSYRLFREGEAEIDNPFFDPFSEQDVVVEGELIGDEWLRVDSIEIIKNE